MYLGEVAEWSIALDLKSSLEQSNVGSNPTLSVVLVDHSIRKSVVFKLRLHRRTDFIVKVFVAQGDDYFIINTTLERAAT